MEGRNFSSFGHLIPGQTILELGAGHGLFTRQLLRITRGENPITSVTFASNQTPRENSSKAVEFINCSSLPGELAGRQFDFVIALDLLDKRNCAWFLQKVYELLKPGGEVIFYESNPWNLVLKLRRLLSRKDPRQLISRPDLYELFSEVGFIRVFSVYNDFVYSPLSRFVWLLRNLSTILENAPGIRTLAASILIHAQKPPHKVDRPKISLFEHEKLRKAISVVIPCHNEETNIEPLVDNLRNFFGDYIHEIILVDDNSQDSSKQVIKRLADEDPTIHPVFRLPPNGVGRALADGFKIATGEYILSMDCDFQHLLPQVRDLFDTAANGDYDVIIGSRFSRHSVLLNYPFKKILANRGFHLLARILFLRRFRDLTNNLKLMRREVVEKLQLTQPGFAVNAEIGLQSLLIGSSVTEVPISWINRTSDMGESSFRLLHAGGGYWRVLLQLWFRNLFKRS